MADIKTLFGMSNSPEEEAVPAEEPMTMPWEAIATPEVTPAASPKDIIESPTASLPEKEIAMEQLDQQKNAVDVEEYNRFKKFQESKFRYDDLAAKAQQKGIKLQMPEFPKLEKFGIDSSTLVKYLDPGLKVAAERQAQKLNSQEQEANQQAAIQNEAAVADRQQSVQQARLEGQMAAQQRQASRYQQLLDEQFKAYDDKQAQLDTIDPDRFWNSRSTFQKVLGTLSIALGEIGKALTKGTENVGLKMINKAIDDDIAAQKVSNEQKLLLKDQALKRVGFEIEKFKAVSEDENKKMAMQSALDQLAAQRLAIRDSATTNMAVRKKLFAEGLTPEEADLHLTSPSDINRKVSLPDGMIKLANNSDAASKLNTELAAGKSAKTVFQELRAATKDYGLLNKLKPFDKKRATVDSFAEALVGALRVPITGPGVLSEKEYDRIMTKVIGDPSSIWTTPGVLEAKLASVQKILNAAQKASYEQAGVKTNMTLADKYRLQGVKDGKSMDKTERELLELQKNKPKLYLD